MNTRHHVPTLDPEKPSEFDHVVKAMPGGEWIADKWKHTPLSCGVLTIESGWQALSWPTRSILSSFQYWDLDGDADRVLVVAPEFVIQMLAWHTAEHVCYFDDLTIPEWTNEAGLPLVAGALAALIACEAGDVFDAAEELDKLVEAAQAAGIERDSYLTVLSSLVGHDDAGTLALAMCSAPATAA